MNKETALSLTKFFFILFLGLLCQLVVEGIYSGGNSISWVVLSFSYAIFGWIVFTLWWFLIITFALWQSKVEWK